MKKRALNVILSAAILLLVFAVAPSGGRVAQADTVEPPIVRVGATETRTMFPLTALSGATSVNTASPLVLSGADASRVGFWSTADVFVGATIGAWGYITVTPQFSNDRVYWANAVTRVLSPTAGTGVLTYQSVPTVLYANGASTDVGAYVRVPIYATYMRLNVATTGTVTATVQVRLIN